MADIDRTLLLLLLRNDDAIYLHFSHGSGVTDVAMATTGVVVT